MKLWLALLLLLLVACAAAFGWQAVVADPGYVLIRFGATRVETTLVFAVVALVLTWALLGLLWRTLRWPQRAWLRYRLRRGQERIAAGLTALAEGNHERALRELEHAAHHPHLRAPALLATARAAHAHGETQRAQAALDDAAKYAPGAALALRARFLLEHGNAQAALALLKPEADAKQLVPLGWQLFAEAALRCADPDAAMQALAALSRDKSQMPEALAALQARVLAAALSAAPDAERLNALWSGLSRSQRAAPEAVAAYARRAAALGQMLAAIDEVESALRRQWSERLIRVYGEMGEANADTRLRRAEGWLDEQPNSPGLLLALGRLCIHCSLWGKAHEYLQRGLDVEPCAALWEALGDCCSGQGKAVDAATCYRNALRLTRGEVTQALSDSARGPLDTRASVVEERNEHGVPRLAGRS